MNQPYSIWADWLSKFHNWHEFIQALWLIVIPVTVLGLAWLVVRGGTQLVPVLSRRYWRGYLIYGVYQDGRGRWMVYWHNRKPEEVDWNNPPPELIGRGTVIQGVFRRPPE